MAYKMSQESLAASLDITKNAQPLFRNTATMALCDQCYSMHLWCWTPVSNIKNLHINIWELVQRLSTCSIYIKVSLQPHLKHLPPHDPVPTQNAHTRAHTHTHTYTKNKRQNYKLKVPHLGSFTDHVQDCTSYFQSAIIHVWDLVPTGAALAMTLSAFRSPLKGGRELQRQV